MKIKFAEVKVGKAAAKNLLDCVDNNWVTKGQKVEQLEIKFGKVMDYDYTVAVSSGTSADFLACLALYDLGAQRGDEIICPALGFIAYANAILAAGFTPVFCDIDRETLNINEDSVENLVTDKTAAILAVNTMGRPCNMKKLRNICDTNGLLLISDNCEGHFCRFENKMMTEWADIVTYSAYAAHLMFAVEMGMICTNYKHLYDSFIANRTHGRPHGNLLFNHTSMGWNAKPTDLHASVGLESIENIDQTLYTRRQNLIEFRNKLEANNMNKVFHIGPQDTEDYFCCPHALSLTFRDDNEKRFLKFFDYLNNNGIEPKLNFRSLPTQQPCYSWMNYKIGDFPESEFVGRNGLHLPVHQYLQDGDIDYMVQKIIDFNT